MFMIFKESIEKSTYEMFFNNSNSSLSLKEITKKSLKDLFI
jgi:hypothetical protein